MSYRTSAILLEEALVSKLKIELSIYGYLRRDKGIKLKLLTNLYINHDSLKHIFTSIKYMGFLRDSTDFRNDLWWTLMASHARDVKFKLALVIPTKNKRRSSSIPSSPITFGEGYLIMVWVNDYNFFPFWAPWSHGACRDICRFALFQLRFLSLPMVMPAEIFSISSHRSFIAQR